MPRTEKAEVMPFARVAKRERIGQCADVFNSRRNDEVR